MQSLTSKERDQQHAIWELISTEHSLLRQLEVVINVSTIRRHVHHRSDLYMLTYTHLTTSFPFPTPPLSFPPLPHPLSSQVFMRCLELIRKAKVLNEVRERKSEGLRG